MDKVLQEYKNQLVSTQSYVNNKNSEISNMFHSSSLMQNQLLDMIDNVKRQNNMLHTPSHNNQNSNQDSYAECNSMNTMVVGNSMTNNGKYYTEQENANLKCCSGNAVLQSGNNYLCQ
jgi:hypothetical protein